MGAFAGNPVLPHDPTAAAVSGLLDSLGGDPGLRLAGSRGKRAFRAGGLVVQTYVDPQGGPASDAALEALPLMRNQSRAMGQFRGVPDPAPAD
jgi:hypothetical protein